MDARVKTRVLTVDPQTPDLAVIEEAASVLLSGGLVAFPTETVYGLGANALEAAAVERIFVAKGRPAFNPLIVHICSISQLESVAVDIPERARELAQVFWPGPLTLVLQRHPQLPANLAAGMPTVAVRMPSHPVASALLHAVGVPVAAPSANLFSRPSPTMASHVLDDLRGNIEIVLDGGPTSIGLESTVLDLTGPAPVLLRPGGVTFEALQNYLPDLMLSPKYLPASAGAVLPSSPGMLTKHYSPGVPLLLFNGAPEAVAARMQATIAQLQTEGRRIGIMARSDDVALWKDSGAEIVVLGEHAAEAEVGRTLFAAMRELERRKVEVILVRAPARAGLGLAIWDRLIRATEGKVIECDQDA